MKRILIITLYFLIVSYNAAGQKKKLSGGYIITKTNDTLACEFEQYNWKKQPPAIKIRINGNDTTIYPNSISGFISPSGNEFVSRKIELFKYNREVQNAAPNDVPFTEVIAAAFLKLLYAGKINLYLYKDALGNEHFFIEKNSSLKEIYIHLYSSIGGIATSTKNPHAKQPVVVNNFQYYFVLKELMQDCKNIFPKVDKTELNANSLISLLKEYEKCDLNLK